MNIDTAPPILRVGDTWRVRYGSDRTVGCVRVTAINDDEVEFLDLDQYANKKKERMQVQHLEWVERLS